MADPSYYSGFYPLHLALLVVGDNPSPVAWWTPISKEPFRFLIAIDRRNYSLALLRELGEAALHLFPWQARHAVVRAGYRSGRNADKASALGLELAPAVALQQTQIATGATTAFELAVVQELASDGDHAPFIFDVRHVHRGKRRPARDNPILFLGWRDFATLGKRWRFWPSR